MDDVPSDLRPYGVILYDLKPKGVTEYKRKINEVLRDISDNPDRSDNPVSDYLQLKSIVTDTFEAKSIEKKLVALVSECSYNLYSADYYLKAIVPEKESAYFYRFQYAALELLISTYYIYPDVSYIKSARTLFHVVEVLNSRVDLMKDENYGVHREKSSQKICL